MRRTILAASLSILTILPAIAADIHAQRSAVLPSAPGLPACDNPSVLAQMVERQHWAEARTWKNGVRIKSITGIHQTYPRTKFVSAIEHRHCFARAALTNRHKDRLYYVISKRRGFASLSWNVEFCMPQHDYYRVYDAGCRVLR